MSFYNYKNIKALNMDGLAYWVSSPHQIYLIKSDSNDASFKFVIKIFFGDRQLIKNDNF